MDFSGSEEGLDIGSNVSVWILLQQIERDSSDFTPNNRGSKIDFDQHQRKLSANSKALSCSASSKLECPPH